MKRKSLPTLKISTPLLMTNSAILTRLPRIMAKVKMIRARTRGPMNSLRIYSRSIFIELAR